MTATGKADEMTRTHDAERRLADAAALHTDGERGKGRRMESFGARFAGAAAQAALACALCAACAVPATAAETGAADGTTTADQAGAAALAADKTLGATRNVTFVCATSDGSLAFPGEEFSVWRVADETGAATGAFSGIENAGDAAAWACALASAAQDVEPDAAFTTDGRGLGSLALAPGKYLVAGGAASSGGTTYQAVPYVMDLTDGTLARDLTSYVKYTTDAPAPAAPDADATNKDGDATSKASWTSGKAAATGGGAAAKTGLAVTGDAVTFGAACAAAGAACAAAVAARKRMKAENEEGTR